MKPASHLIAFACMISPLAAQPPAKSPDTLFREGQAAEKAGDPIAARESYTKALKLDPNHANSLFSLGQLKLNSATIAAKGRETKFGAVVVPAYRLDEASLQEALDALSLMIEKESKEEVTPNFVIQDPAGKLADRKISINLKATPAKEIIKYVLEQTGAKARFDEHAVVIVPR